MPQLIPLPEFITSALNNPYQKPRQLIWFLEALSQLNSSECVVWPFYKNRDGYGKIKVSNKQYSVHRLAFMLTHESDMFDGPEVMHQCDNRPCFNPNHLRTGTRDDNMHDAALKGRMPRGSRHHNALLRPEDIQQIRKLRVQGEQLKSIAQRFGVATPTITGIIYGQRWAWLSKEVS